jgi:deazaflavin-dependent oxidoreductase (nitroreductase family)
MAERDDWNARIIEEFRANDGQVGGPFDGAPLLLLHSTGARTGVERINPLMYRRLGDKFAVFASKGGSATNPDWYHNLLVHPEAVVEVGTETVSVKARVVRGEERDVIWGPHKVAWPMFAEYESKAGREIPVVVLEPTA